ncbi:hypothetical protein VFPFJ_00555 [Purpureocillium lilacinum]|uniref:Uncharacterized protein n=1 Tax=Purpureocillium lilacinum TaxID=33203 RepID=A0A179HAF3_PURLI|nr:hypothetical protein VFPFJ_00555 [Purpureocillium lilacinum]OAQ86483.1 hypothetical protein VFPBJ_00523 [Purpureocillium lilacinum]OAQ94446.1 hypothetical protein VFPFJ_00555 [Purpureocillium lilacinum]
MLAVGGCCTHQTATSKVAASALRKVAARRIGCASPAPGCGATCAGSKRADSSSQSNPCGAAHVRGSPVPECPAADASTTAQKTHYRRWCQSTHRRNPLTHRQTGARTHARQLSRVDDTLRSTSAVVCCAS